MGMVGSQHPGGGGDVVTKDANGVTMVNGRYGEYRTINGVKTWVNGPAPVGSTKPVTSTSTGAVTSDQSPTAADGSTSFGDDPTYDIGSANAAANMASQNLALQNSQAQGDLQYQNQLRDIGIQQPIAQRNLLNQAASSGLANSSSYGYNVGQQAAAFQRQIGDIQARQNMLDTQTAAGIAQNNLNYQGILEGLKSGAAANLSQRAGTLGLSS